MIPPLKSFFLCPPEANGSMLTNLHMIFVDDLDEYTSLFFAILFFFFRGTASIHSPVRRWS